MSGEFFFNDTATTEIYTLSLHDALPIWPVPAPGCSLGYHEHHGETETYPIIAGEGVYSDNGAERAIHAGDTFFCDDGGGHGIRNTGADDLVFIALIIRK